MVPHDESESSAGAANGSTHTASGTCEITKQGVRPRVDAEVLRRSLSDRLRMINSCCRSVPAVAILLGPASNFGLPRPPGNHARLSNLLLQMAWSAKIFITKEQNVPRLGQFL